jgi:hypothetical protein
MVWLVLTHSLMTAVPSPEQAVQILLASRSDRHATARICDSPCEPRAVSTGATSPTLGPWSFPPSAPPRRLDGSLLSDPPAHWPILLPGWWVPLHVPIQPVRKR